MSGEAVNDDIRHQGGNTNKNQLSFFSACFRFPTGIIGVPAGALSGAPPGVESLVSGTLAHGIPPVSHPPHAHSPGQPTKAEADRDIPSDQ